MISINVILDQNLDQILIFIQWMSADGNAQKSHEKKNNSYFPLYWMVNRDPYNGYLKSLYNWVV